MTLYLNKPAGWRNADDDALYGLLGNMPNAFQDALGEPSKRSAR